MFPKVNSNLGSKLNNIHSLCTYGNLLKIGFYLNRNLNKLTTKYQLHSKLTKIDIFERKYANVQQP